MTNRDLRFIRDYSMPISEVMTKENLVTAPVGTTLKEAEEILQKHKIEKLPLVDETRVLKGLITIKDIEKATLFPNAAKDAQGRLLAGAAVGVPDDTTSGRPPWWKRRWMSWWWTPPTATPEGCAGDGGRTAAAVSGSLHRRRKCGHGGGNPGPDRSGGQRGQGGDRARLHLHHPGGGRESACPRSPPSTTAPPSPASTACPSSPTGGSATRGIS